MISEQKKESLRKRREYSKKKYPGPWYWTDDKKWVRKISKPVLPKGHPVLPANRVNQYWPKSRVFKEKKNRRENGPNGVFKTKAEINKFASQLWKNITADEKKKVVDEFEKKKSEYKFRLEKYKKENKNNLWYEYSDKLSRFKLYQREQRNIAKARSEQQFIENMGERRKIEIIKSFINKTPSRIQIFCKTITGRTVTLDLKDENESIDDLYIKYKKKINFDPYSRRFKIRLIFAGKPLVTGLGYDLKHYKIKKEATIHDVIKLGGWNSPTEWFKKTQECKKLYQKWLNYNSADFELYNKEKIATKRKALSDNNKEKIKRKKEIEYNFSNEDIEKCLDILRGNSKARSNCRHLANGILEYFRTEKLPVNKANINSTANLPYSSVVVKSEADTLLVSNISNELFQNQQIFPGNQIYNSLPEGVVISNFCDLTNPNITRYSHGIKQLTNIIIERGQTFNYGIVDFLGIHGNVGHQLNFYKRKDEVIYIDCQFKKGERLFTDIESKYKFGINFSHQVAFTMFSFN